MLQLSGAGCRQFGSDLVYLLENDLVFEGELGLAPLVLIVSLSAFTKQSTYPFQATESVVVPKEYYCLVPDFFLMLTFSSFSAMSIMVSRQMIFIRASSRAAINSFCAALLSAGKPEG